MPQAAADRTGATFLEQLRPGTVELIERHAMAARFRPGAYLFGEGEPADRFFVLRGGRVALELHAPGRQPLLLDTIGPGQVVGWSWLVPPRRWFCDGRAVDEVSALVVDADRLRTDLEADRAAGYEVMQLVTHEMYRRPPTARGRL